MYPKRKPPILTALDRHFKKYPPAKPDKEKEITAMSDSQLNQDPLMQAQGPGSSGGVGYGGQQQHPAEPGKPPHKPGSEAEEKEEEEKKKEEEEKKKKSQPAQPGR
jgi:hypothetical protein